jgi:histidine triad (HIT) family protein
MDCIFCRIAAGEIPATVVARNEHGLAFRDLNPQAPTHVLVIPVRHFESASAVPDQERAAVLGELLRLAVQIADQLGVADAGYRMVINTGKQGGQTVDHLHLHLLGGRQMHWPPG